MTTSLSLPIRASFAFCAAFASSLAGAQVVANGDFETGTLANWTPGGTNAAAVIRASDIAPNPGTAIVPQPPGASAANYFAILSTGPGDRGGGAQRYDANTVDDFDLATLSQTFTLPFAGAVISFDWTFPTSEQDQPDTYDDLFDLRANGVQIWSGSACKNNGSSYSNFPNAPCSGLSQNTWTVNGPPAVNGTQLRFGIGAWQHVCVPLPSSLNAGDAVTLRYAALDQNDNQYDSALLLDNIRVASACDATVADALRQLTNTTGQDVRLKNGTLTLRPVTNTKPAVDDTGINVAFISDANLTADNPNLLAQVFIWNGASFTRATSLIVDSTGSIDSVALSGALDSGYKGRYIAIAARLSSGGSAQIYRYDRSTNALSTVTATSNCDSGGQYALDNVNPSISTDGTRIAWESECASLTGAANGVKRVVYATLSGTTWTVKAPITSATTCTANNPRLSRSANGRYLVLDSICNPTGGNAAGNHVVFRVDTNTTTFAQELPGTNTTLAASPSLDSTGNYTLYLNFDATGHSEIWRYDAPNNRTRQVTSTAASNTFLDVHAAADVTATGGHFAYERVDTSTGLSEVGYGTIGGTSTAPTATLTPVGQGFPSTSSQIITGARIGLDATTPVVTFYSDFDFLGTNADNNPEIFQARGQ